MSKKNFNPENKDEANFVKETTAKFESKSKVFEKDDEIVILSEEEKEFLMEGLEDSKYGRVISSEEARKMAEECFK